eukprot:TRINITY_DN26684_c0_g1_i1.p1 TRINITY_DN26684_c0_g1~~TRINITY_DN26684_c0_g1_i1.p1  ORF type:complete len:164 (-),score=30.20 TRINITY_DN26684_c0_g1_i1:477-968(-)
MATCAAAKKLLETSTCKPEITDEFTRFEVATEADTDSESDDEEFSFSHQPTVSTVASVEVEVRVEDLGEIELETNIQHRIDTRVPHKLAIDEDDNVQIVQEMKWISPGAFTCSSTSNRVESRLVPKKLMPKRPPGVFYPPGVFFQSPPGLPAPERAVKSLPGP